MWAPYATAASPSPSTTISGHGTPFISGCPIRDPLTVVHVAQRSPSFGAAAMPHPRQNIVCTFTLGSFRIMPLKNGATLFPRTAR